MIRRIGLATTIATVAGFALVMPGAASAATTLGETFVPTGSCGTETTYIQTVSGGQPYSAPYSGVITSWSFQPPATAAPSTIKLKVGRVPPGADLTTDTSITIIGESALQTPSGSGLNTFPTRIPVQAGDDIGIYIAGGGIVHTCNSDSAYTDHFFSADVAPGSTETFTQENFHHDVSATLEPDCDKDGLGDETQDADLLDCHNNAFTFAGVTRNKKKGTATVKVNVPEPGELSGSGNGAKVSSAGAVISKSVGAGQATLLIKAKGKKKRKLNQTGKVKLNLAVTYTPTGGKPNNQSTQVKLKKKL